MLSFQLIRHSLYRLLCSIRHPSDNFLSGTPFSHYQQGRSTTAFFTYRGITLSENGENSALEYTLELRNMMLEHEIKLNQKVERMSQFSGSDVLAVPPSISGTYSESEINTILATKANTRGLEADGLLNGAVKKSGIPAT